MGKVLGYLVSRKVIEANPDKIKAIAELHPPQIVKEVQKLTNHIAALNRFISKLAKCSLPFLNVLRGANDFAWGLEQAVAFEDLNHTFQSWPLYPIRPKEPSYYSI
jgi:hypothetical protein